MSEDPISLEGAGGRPEASLRAEGAESYPLRQLVRKIGVKEKSISRYEAGKSVPMVETVTKLAKALKKPAAHCVDGAA